MTKKEEPGQLAGFERMAQEFSNRLKREWSNSFCKLWNNPKERYIILKGLLFLWHLLMKQEPFTWKSWRINLVISNISINFVHNYYKMMASTKPWCMDSRPLCRQQHYWYRCQPPGAQISWHRKRRGVRCHEQGSQYRDRKNRNLWHFPQENTWHRKGREHPNGLLCLSGVAANRRAAVLMHGSPSSSKGCPDSSDEWFR